MPEKHHYFVQLLGTRHGWPENMTAEEERIMGEHFDYLKKLVSRKKVLVAGPVFNPVFGLILLQTESEQEARAIMDAEPSVRQGVHNYELHPMRVALLCGYTPSDRYVTDQSDKVLSKEVVVASSLDQVWNAWTTTEGVKSFFSPNANIELRNGGPYEIYFNMEAPYGQRGSEDCCVLSFLPKRMLSFEWNAPPSFGELRHKRTQVILMFESVSENQVKVTLTHIGWGRGKEWDKLFEYFDKAWAYVLGNLKESFE